MDFSSFAPRTRAILAKKFSECPLEGSEAICWIYAYYQGFLCWCAPVRRTGTIFPK